MIMMQGLVPEEFGGDIQCVPISALKGTNVDALTEAIVTQAELSDLRADPSGKVEGIVIETRQDTHLGYVLFQLSCCRTIPFLPFHAHHFSCSKISTALIRRGTLRKNCILTAGLAWARVRQMLDEHRNTLKEAPPSTPVEVVGWQALPNPGDIILEVESEVGGQQVSCSPFMDTWAND